MRIEYNLQRPVYTTNGFFIANNSMEKGEIKETKLYCMHDERNRCTISKNGIDSRKKMKQTTKKYRKNNEKRRAKRKMKQKRNKNLLRKRKNAILAAQVNTCASCIESTSVVTEVQKLKRRKEMKTRKQWLAMLLMLAMLFTALPMAAFAEGEPEEAAAEAEPVEGNTPAEEKKGTIKIKWHHYDTGKGFYNADDEGKEVTLILGIKATGTDAHGNKKSFVFVFNPVSEEFNKPTTMKIGEEYFKEISLKSLQDYRGNVYTDCELYGQVVQIDGVNRIYSLSSSTSSPNKVEFIFVQNMETKTIAKIADGATIAEADKPKMMVRYWIEMSKNGGEFEKVQDNQNNVLEETRPFQEGEVKFIAEPGSNENCFWDAVWQNQLNGYSPYTGKHTKFHLKADWTGPHKEELHKRYKLDVTGNDLEGWTVTLSNRPEEKPGKPDRPDRPSVPSVKELVIFDANGGSWANGETRREYRRAVGSVITIESAPMREGYKFLYWKGSEFHPGENYTVPAGGHTFVAQWEKVEKKPEDKPSAPSVDAKIKTPRGSALTAEEIAKILAGSKKVVPAIPRAGVGR